METFREISRSFFSLFLLLSCFIGCGHSMYWMEKLAANQAKAPIHRYYKNRGYNIDEEEFNVDKAAEEIMNDTTNTDEYDEYDTLPVIDRTYRY